MVMTVGPDNKVTPKTVQTGGWIGSDFVITSGLAESDQVIVDNLVKVRPGAVVQPHPAGQPTPQTAAQPSARTSTATK
jgi:membrane fusion protein (multidrug efflux system)